MFGGNIVVDKCAHLVKTIRAEVEKDKKRKGKVRPELAAAEKWLQQAERRRREAGTRVKRGERGTAVVGPGKETGAVLRNRRRNQPQLRRRGRSKNNCSRRNTGQGTP